STVTDTQVFDDGSKLITETDNYGKSTTSSVDSLESRIDRANTPALIDPRTASEGDIGTAQDIMDNYRNSMPPDMVDNLNTFINDYWLNQSSFFPDTPPLPPYNPQTSTGTG